MSVRRWHPAPHWWAGGALLVASGLVTLSTLWGRSVQRDVRVKLGAAPLVGVWDWRPSLGTLAAAAVAVAVVLGGSRVAVRVRWPTLLALAAVAAAAFTLVLAASDGLTNILNPVVHPTEYWANLATLPPPAEMLRRYGSTDFLLGYSVHAKGHPPGFLLLLQGMDGIGLGRPWAVGALSYVGVAALTVGVLMTVRAVVDEEAARRVAPFLALPPYAVWAGTSADAFFTGWSALGIAALASAVAATRRSGAAAATGPTGTTAAAGAIGAANGRGRRLVLGATGGTILGAALFLSYGVATLLVLPALLMFRHLRRAPRATIEVAAAGAVGALVVTGTFAAMGFWWFTGLRVTKTFYWWGTAQFRPGEYFFVANLAVTMIAIGPATVAALGWLRDRRVAWIVGGAWLALLVANASNYSKGEVERIWLLFFPWLLVATAALVSHHRAWLAVQAAVAIGLQTVLVSKW